MAAGAAAASVRDAMNAQTLASTHTHTRDGAAASPASARAATAAPATAPPSLGKRIRAFLLAQHLPLGLVLAIAIGFAAPEPGIALGKTPMNTISICGIFFISGLQLQTNEIKAALKAHKAIVFGCLSILLFTPLTSLAITHLPLGSRAYSQGLALFAAMPTTISSGVLMTAEARGNVTLALFFSVVTNLVAVATVPLFAAYILAGAQSVSLDPLDLLWKLVVTILVPLLVGKALRVSPSFVRFVSSHKTALKLTSSALLISVPWVNISQSADKLRTLSAGDFFALIALGSGMHVAFLAFNYACVRALRLALPEAKSVVINGSQKTVNTAMSVIQFLPSGASDRGLLTLPIVLSHFAQIIIDAFVVAAWKRGVQDKQQGAAQETTPAVAQPGAAAAMDTDIAAAVPDGADTHTHAHTHEHAPGEQAWFSPVSAPAEHGTELLHQQQSDVEP